MVLLLAFCGCNAENQPAIPPVTVRAFTATWCAACKKDEPRLARLARQGVVIERIDVDIYPKVAGQFGVVTIPAYFQLDHATGNWSRVRIR